MKLHTSPTNDSSLFPTQYSKSLKKNLIFPTPLTFHCIFCLISW